MDLARGAFSVLSLVAFVACGSAKVETTVAPVPLLAADPAAVVVSTSPPPPATPAVPALGPADCWNGRDVTGPFAGRDFTLDPRCKIAPRAEEAIFEEIAKLETRLKSLANGDPARADVLRQLTDGYFELGRRQGRGTDAATASFKESARYADLLIKEFPSDAKLQEVRYYRAIAFEWSAELDAERKALREYMQLYPKAPELPCVRLMLGESWISDGKNTPAKLRSARKEFKECAKIPATENACFTYAEYYLATIPENPEEITPPSRARKNIPSGSPASSGSPSSSGM